MAESTNTPGIQFSEYPKAAFAGFYNPVLGIRNFSSKLPVSSSFIFSGVCAITLYVLSFVLTLCSYIFKDYDPNVLSIIIDALVTYACLTFGVAGIAWIASAINNTAARYHELLSTVTMSIIPGSLIIILGQSMSFLPYIGAFFGYIGRAYIAILLFENLKDDRLGGKKQFFTAAIITALGIAFSYIF